MHLDQFFEVSKEDESDLKSLGGLPEVKTLSRVLENRVTAVEKLALTALMDGEDKAAYGLANYAKALQDVSTMINDLST